MKSQISVVIAGRALEDLKLLEKLVCQESGFTVRIKHITNGHSDPLHGVVPVPDVLIFNLSQQWEHELDALGARAGTERPPAIAVGPEGDTKVMRAAMQAGARDFFSHPVVAEDLIASLRRLAREHASQTQRGGATSKLTVVMNAKGGSGASFIACNIAHMIRAQHSDRVALLDLDLQFGTLPLYFDLPASDNLLGLLSDVEHLDKLALEGYMLKHKSGLHLLPTMSERVPLPWQIPERSVERLLQEARFAYEHLVADLPRQIDPVTTTTLEQADRVLLVMQQGLTHLRDAKHLMQVMTKDLAVPGERISIIVNRYTKDNPVGLEQVRDVLECADCCQIPNDYGVVSEAINLGVPLLNGARKSPVTKGLLQLTSEVVGDKKPARRGLLSSALAHLGLREIGE